MEPLPPCDTACADTRAGTPGRRARHGRRRYLHNREHTSQRAAEEPTPDPVLVPLRWTGMTEKLERERESTSNK